MNVYSLIVFRSIYILVSYSCICPHSNSSFLFQIRFCLYLYFVLCIWFSLGRPVLGHWRHHRNNKYLLPPLLLCTIPPSNTKKYFSDVFNSIFSHYDTFISLILTGTIHIYWPLSYSAKSPPFTTTKYSQGSLARQMCIDIFPFHGGVAAD